MGKTLSLLFAIIRDVELTEAKVAADPEYIPNYAASIVICLGQSVEVWASDIEKFFGRRITILQYYSTLSMVTDPMRRSQLVDFQVN